MAVLISMFVAATASSAAAASRRRRTAFSKRASGFFASGDGYFVQLLFYILCSAFRTECLGIIARKQKLKTHITIFAVITEYRHIYNLLPCQGDTLIPVSFFVKQNPVCLADICLFYPCFSEDSAFFHSFVPDMGR
jgi:hypothetical protein